ncbi:hypothetical protein E4191_16745 (plasmid) [Paracoccus liaowanqingii]|uniref:Uncharacterized protein n=1 Tax=Paracoccus liaowanqingii TaxID=2560053 RepID=A0A4Y5SR36_9RHOB|nr:hypothetical protein [Paracoccus liaowanqingii]QDA35809.1 hypothetical protein E4191_16745 [Paracoccus liaowanqingii]
MIRATLHTKASADMDILSSMRRRIDALDLDLQGMTVLTEAATGAYACTAPIAAMAGARVVSIARNTRSHGTAANAIRATRHLAAAAGVADRIIFRRELPSEFLSTCDILTNSGHLRPITASIIDQLPKTAVIALMFEAWEFRHRDLDLAACRRRGIRIAAVNERHPDVGVFPFLGPLCVRLVAQGGVNPRGARIALLCDNPFASFIQDGLQQAGALVECFQNARSITSRPWAAVVVALDPTKSPMLDRVDLLMLRAAAPDALLAQFWGDIDRAAAADFWPGTLCPQAAPAPGHMAILLSALGHEPIVRLQAGGLKAAELVARDSLMGHGSVAELV